MLFAVISLSVLERSRKIKNVDLQECLLLSRLRAAWKYNDFGIIKYFTCYCYANITSFIMQYSFTSPNHIKQNAYVVPALTCSHTSQIIKFCSEGCNVWVQIFWKSEKNKLESSDVTIVFGVSNIQASRILFARKKNRTKSTFAFVKKSR